MKVNLVWLTPRLCSRAREIGLQYWCTDLGSGCSIWFYCSEGWRDTKFTLISENRTKFNVSAVLDGGESGMKVTYHTYQMSRSISVNCHGSCPLLCGCHGYLACCRSPWWQAGCQPIGWEQLWARRITMRSLAKAPGGRRNTCAQRSLLDFGRWASEGGLLGEEKVKSRKRGDEKRDQGHDS